MDGNDLGDELKVAIMPLINALNQTSDPAQAEAFQTAIFRAWGNTIVNHIKARATIDYLQFWGMLPNDGAMHTHMPGCTDIATGKIS